jgi:hypothetical protein
MRKGTVEGAASPDDQRPFKIDHPLRRKTTANRQLTGTVTGAISTSHVGPMIIPARGERPLPGSQWDVRKRVDNSIALGNS